jgi:hypothetical protein
MSGEGIPGTAIHVRDSRQPPADVPIQTLLQNRIAALEAENAELRRQLVALKAIRPGLLTKEAIAAERSRIVDQSPRPAVGSDEYYEEMGREIEAHPIGPGVMRR